MQAETARTLKSSFVSAMLIKHRPLLNLDQKKTIIIFSYVLKAKYKFEPGRLIANLPEKMENDYTYANACHFAKKTSTSNIILHKLE